MARFQVILAYDGTDFYGFQRQVGQRTVQSVVEQVLSSLNWEGDSLLAAGRTDSGVHARGQVIAFDLAWDHSPEALLRALNAGLPADVAARQVKSVLDDFHPRYHAIARKYRYEILFDPKRDPLNERFAWRLWPVLDLAKMNRSAGVLIGSHDFEAFGSPPKPEGTSVRAVYRVGWEGSSERCRFEITANSYLYHMVRRIVKVLVGVGQGKYDPGIVAEMLETRQANQAQGMAPAKGLFLDQVLYPGMMETEALLGLPTG